MEPTPGLLDGEPPTPEALEAARRAIRELATAPGDTGLTDRLDALLDGAATGSTAPLAWIALALAAAAFAAAFHFYRRKAAR